MGVNLDDVLGNKKQEVLFDKSKRTMNLLLIGNTNCYCGYSYV